jgi:D-aspartate ligase
MIRHFGMPAVAVFDADTPPSLAFVRSLGRLGVPVNVYGAQRLSLANCSRYATTRRLAPPIEDAAAFLPFLIDALRRGTIDLIAPTSDLMAFYLACVEEHLSPSMRAVVPSRSALLDVLMKDRFHARCAALGQPTPRTLCPTSVAEALDGADALTWPLILKPRSHVGVGAARGLLVRDRDELAREFRPYAIADQSVLVHAPDLRWPMLQEYVPDALQNLYAVSGVLDADGAVVASSVSRKSTQWPPHLGVGTMFSAHHDQRVLDLGVSLARALLGRGIFELELIHDHRTDTYSAIDLNPRAFGQMTLDIARGNDLPSLWYRLAIGEPVPPCAEPVDDVRWMHAIPYYLGQWIGVAKGPQRMERALTYLDSVAHKHVGVVHDRSDILPVIAFTAKMLRHPGGLVRPFFGTKT